MKKSIAILGGMGPEASGYLYKTLIERAIKDFGAKNNDQFPDIAIFSVPVPDFIANETNEEASLTMLKQKIKSIDNDSILYFSIACNTAHLLLEDLQRETTVPFLSMIDETVKKVKQAKIKKVGLLGTPMTLKTGLYSQKFNQNGIETLIPSEKQIKEIEKIIRNIIAGKNKLKDRQKLIHIADGLQANGAEAIILGCTELPLIFPKQYKPPVFNSVAVLADALLHKYYGQNIM